MEHKFTEAQSEEILSNVAQRIHAGETEQDKVVAEETQKVIEQATAKTLTELNSKFEKELKNYFENMDITKKTYEKYFNGDRYSNIEKDRQKQLMQREFNLAADELESTLNYEINKFMKNFEPDVDTISDMEYQVKLGNILKLLEINPNLEVEYFDFIVDAKDYRLLNLLKNKYKTDNLLMLSASCDVEKIEKLARQKANTIVSYLRKGESFVPRSVFFQILR